MNDSTPDNAVMYEDTIAGGAHWSLVVRQGMVLRLIDVEGGANVGMLMYNPEEKLERYNAPDTLKCQHTFFLTKGHCLYSDMGRIFCSIIDDDLGWHDTVGGYLHEHRMNDKYSVKRYQEALNDRHLSGEHCFLTELAKYGLGRRDLSANVNFFSKLQADESGNLTFVNGHSAPGASVDLRFEMDTLVILQTCPHPLNPASDYPRKAVAYQLRKADALQPDDVCMNACDENRRGFQNNALYYLQRRG